MVTENLWSNPVDGVFARVLAGRSIKALVHAPVTAANAKQLQVRSRSAMEWTDNAIRISVGGDDGTSITVSVTLPQATEAATGIAARVRLRGWSNMRYLAFGYLSDGDFRHVKSTNLPMDSWFDLVLDRSDLAFKLQNSWDDPTEDQIPEVRIMLSRAQECLGGTIEISHVAVWTEELTVGRTLEIRNNQRLLEKLGRYFDAKFPFAQQQNAILMEGQEFPILADRSLPWPAEEPMPSGIAANPTYRYIWHSLQHFAVLAVEGARDGSREKVELALRQILGWIERSFRIPDPDKKYAWYDHGTAERLISLITIRIAAEDFLDVRSRTVINSAIDAHARLLQSESFYACNQRMRYHNHALFQDLALLCAGAAVSGIAARYWATHALERIQEQLDALVTVDGPYAVFGENSTGYHEGVESMVQLIGELEEVAVGSSNALILAGSMREFSKLMSPGYGRTLAIGDTYRLPNPQDVSEEGEVYASGSYTLPNSGYGVLHGHDKGDPFQLVMVGSSVSSTHKHQDHLSITLVFLGIEWLVDPSFYSHDYSAGVPAYLRSPWAHNMVVIDGVECSIEPGLTKISAGSSEQGLLFSGSTTAYQNYEVSRSIHGSDSQLKFDVLDNVEPTPEASYLNFHLGEGVIETVGSNSILLEHPATPRALKLTIPGRPTVLSGWHGEASRSSVAASSFERVSDSRTLRVPLPGGSVRWSLEALDSAEAWVDSASSI